MRFLKRHVLGGVFELREHKMFLWLGIMVIASFLAACSAVPEGEQSFPQEDPKEYRYGKAAGEEGIVIFGGKKERNRVEGGGFGSGIGVNAFLWRAALDTVNFMPLASADPFGGVILTDWYAPRETPEERFKISVFIQDKQLRADGIKVSVFRQRREGGDWRDAPTDALTAKKLEDAILTRARQLRIESSGEAS